MNAIDLPFKIRIASPCPARWEDMGGDHRVRFCDHCRKNVHNVSSMTAAETAALLGANGQGNVCVRLYQRADGTLLAEDCPVGVARHWRRVKTLVVGGVAAILMTMAHLSALGRDEDEDQGGAHPRSRFMTDANSAVWKLKERLGLNPPTRTMGEVSIMVPKPKTPANPPATPPKN
jgi:hypothetical protein